MGATVSEGGGKLLTASNLSVNVVLDIVIFTPSIPSSDFLEDAGRGSFGSFSPGVFQSNKRLDRSLSRWV